MTIQTFAIEMQMSVDRLIQQFLDAGITKTAFDFVTKKEREILFKHMNCNKIAVFNKLSLQRKIRSTLNVSSMDGKNKKIQIEVRKKRVYMVKCSIQDSYSVAQSHILLQNKKKNNNLKHDDSELVVECNLKNSKSMPVYANNIDISVFTPKSVVEEDCSSAMRVLCPTEKKLETKICCVVDHKTQKLENIRKQKGPLDSKGNKFNYDQDLNNVLEIKKNISDNFHKVIPSNEVIQDNSNKLENDRRSNGNKIRLRYKNLGKVIKHKRYCKSKSYIDIMNESEKEEKLCVSTTTYRVNKNKRKKSILLQSFNKPVDMISRDVVIGETISVSELSNKISVKSSYMIKVMMKLGLSITINQVLDQETAQLIVEEMGHRAILRRENELEELVMHHGDLNQISDSSVSSINKMVYKNRAPIVTIMGHVDHGKTSLLDCIRSTTITSSEVGGITQSIGAYCVNTANGGMITFLDTPGHEAFTRMRAQGVKLTDIVVLVVAADDGVMPQTIESINHIHNANVPVIVAINKIDKSKINIDRIKQELNNYNLIPEEWGGHTQFVNISAMLKIGINDLIDSILLQSEMLELKTVHYGMAKAVVIDSFLDKSRGPVASVLVREGELKCGNIILCGSEYGRVKAMRNSFGRLIESAGPSIPVELLGLSGTPVSGETLVVVSNEKKAKEVALYRKEKKREIKLSSNLEQSTLKNIFNNINSTSKVSELNFIVKSDTDGAAEVICESLKKLVVNGILMKIVSVSIGNITETDAVLASASKAIILAFNIKADIAARNIIESHHIDVRYYAVIYDLLNSVQQLICSKLTPKHKYEIIGLAKVRNIFKSPKNGIIAGCLVTQGVMKSHKKVKIIRNDVVIHEGELESLRHFKNDVNEIRSGVECGVGIKNYNDICAGDVIEVLDIK
ncbi:translation initiation factor IF-2 [Candidatus Blochmanniella vafra str. BVAF]|uniref:Translation initiation factor IF-2 n=1 Tax=Blochmanniella vafra (strain BVAF) TaxID=859654 RepID=E8Q6S1_BLOVB|nr:translation initiation factor IF-2 [Candidatus Blochmannia vafer]ADV33512.1 translation initiation factor IF-2 [Candidatus Blochmannia vafer str. BVAF]